MTKEMTDLPDYGSKWKGTFDLLKKVHFHASTSIRKEEIWWIDQKIHIGKKGVKAFLELICSTRNSRTKEGLNFEMKLNDIWLETGNISYFDKYFDFSSSLCNFIIDHFFFLSFSFFFLFFSFFFFQFLLRGNLNSQSILLFLLSTIRGTVWKNMGRKKKKDQVLHLWFIFSFHFSSSFGWLNFIH